MMDLKSLKLIIENSTEKVFNTVKKEIINSFNDLKKKKINVSRATLYRTIDVFVKHGLLKKLILDDGKFLYEHNKKTITPQHDHIVCEDCGEIFEFFDNSISQIEDKIAKDLNLKVTKRVHQLSATCTGTKCNHIEKMTSSNITILKT